jgi:hypothetical protein
MSRYPPPPARSSFTPVHLKETGAINQPPTDEQSRDCFYDRPVNRKPECSEAEDREQNPERFPLSAQSVQFPGRSVITLTGSQAARSWDGPEDVTPILE